MPISARMAAPCSPMRGAGGNAASTSSGIPGVCGVGNRPISGRSTQTAPPVATMWGSASQSSKPLTRSAKMSAERSRASQPSVVSVAKSGRRYRRARQRARRARQNRQSAGRRPDPAGPAHPPAAHIALRAPAPPLSSRRGSGRRRSARSTAAARRPPAHFGELVAKDRRRASRQADLDPPSLAAALARIKRTPESLRRIEAGQGIDDNRPDPMRRPVIAEVYRISPEKACATELVQGRPSRGLPGQSR